MARTQRYAQYQYAPWPDPALLETVQSLNDIVLLYSVNQHRDGLTVDITDNRYYAPDDPSAALNEGSHSRMLRLTWAFMNEVYALQSYSEFYAGPFLTYHPHYQGVKSPGLYEVVNEPDPWIAEIVAENSSSTFPSYGSPIMDEQHWYGRYFAANAPISDSGRHDIHFWTGPTKPTPAELQEATAKAEARAQERWQQQKGKPRYRHLILSTENLLVELLCDDLPQWEWVTG